MRSLNQSVVEMTGTESSGYAMTRFPNFFAASVVGIVRVRVRATAMFYRRFWWCVSGKGRGRGWEDREGESRRLQDVQVVLQGLLDALLVRGK